MTSSDGNIFRYWPFVRGIHRSPVNSSHKDQWRAALVFSLISAWTNGWIFHIFATREKTVVCVGHSCRSSYILPTITVHWNVLTSLVLKPEYSGKPSQYRCCWWPGPNNRVAMYERHNDVIKWKHFPRYWPFVRWIHQPSMDSLTKASDAEHWCLCVLRLNKRLSKQSRGRWFETPSRSLWRHCNGSYRPWRIPTTTSSSLLTTWVQTNMHFIIHLPPRC